jgi:hypothetical protein
MLLNINQIIQQKMIYKQLILDFCLEELGVLRLPDFDGMTIMEVL